MPVRAEAQPLLAGCDGALTFAGLADQFGQPGLELLGDLWEMGLLDVV
jgi:hypothetical protein